ncbi:MAG: sigma-E factor negative regulatory protein [Usitatibacter sp.]
MTQDISSLMDGELEAHEAGRVVQACCASEDQKQAWYVYHVIGDTMRGHAPRESGFPHRTLEALREQPTVLAPRRRTLDTAFTRIALAAAASVATVGVVGWLGLQGGQIHTAPEVAKATQAAATSVAANVPANGTVAVSSNQPVLNVQDYLTVHRQIPSPEFYRQVSSQAPATAR